MAEKSKENTQNLNNNHEKETENNSHKESQTTDSNSVNQNNNAKEVKASLLEIGKNYEEYGLDTPKKESQRKKSHSDKNLLKYNKENQENESTINKTVVLSKKEQQEEEEKKRRIRDLHKRNSLVLQIDELSAQKNIKLNSEISKQKMSLEKDSNLKESAQIPESIDCSSPHSHAKTDSIYGKKISPIEKDKEDDLNNVENYESKNSPSPMSKNIKNKRESGGGDSLNNQSSILQIGNPNISKSNNSAFSKHQQRRRTTAKVMNNIDYQRYMFKVILLGNIAVGKTCLLSYFVDSLFKNEYTCTVGVDFKIKTVLLEPNKKVDLQIWDTSGEERFKTITRQYYRDASGILLVFDVTNEKSFADVVHWIEDIKLCAKSNVSIVLVGNKSDLESQRVVSQRTAEQYAYSNNIKYYETSAKTGFYVSELFEDLAQIMVHISDMDDLKAQKEKSDTNNSFIIQKKDKDISYYSNMNEKSKISNTKNKKKNCC